jgi:hypothetical protein
MGRSKATRNVTVVLTALILVFDGHRYGRPGAHSLKNPAEYFQDVVFLALSGNARLPGLSTRQLSLNKSFVDRQASGTTVDNHANGRTMRLTKGCNAKNFSERVSHETV